MQPQVDAWSQVSAGETLPELNSYRNVFFLDSGFPRGPNGSREQQKQSAVNKRVTRHSEQGALLEGRGDHHVSPPRIPHNPRPFRTCDPPFSGNCRWRPTSKELLSTVYLFHASSVSIQQGHGLDHQGRYPHCGTHQLEQLRAQSTRSSRHNDNYGQIHEQVVGTLLQQARKCSWTLKDPKPVQASPASPAGNLKFSSFFQLSCQLQLATRIKGFQPDARLL